MLISTMKNVLISLAVTCSLVLNAAAEVTIDPEVFGNALGGWTKRDKKAAEYDLSGTSYRTYKPEVSPTPDGGIFVSVRIDHVRGWLSSDDHAILEVTVSPKGMIASAQSNIAIQGRSIASDVILGANEAGQQAVGVDRAVQIGTDLVSDLSAKLLREKIVEAGRVSFPSVIRHNFNLLFQAVRWHGLPVAPGAPGPPVATPVPGADIAVNPAAATPTPPVETSAPPTTEAAPEAPKEAADTPAKPEDSPGTPPASEPANAPLEIKPYSTPGPSTLPPTGT
jgi:cell division septation protein DedD